MAELLHELTLESACRPPAAVALRYCSEERDYAALAQQVEQAADGLLALGPLVALGYWIKKGGYRVSPSEVGATGLVAEVAAIGVAHPVLGQAIVLLATPIDDAELDPGALFAACRCSQLADMLPAMVDVRTRPLPRNPNGKVDRRLLADELAHLFAEAAS